MKRCLLLLAGVLVVLSASGCARGGTPTTPFEPLPPGQTFPPPTTAPSAGRDGTVDPGRVVTGRGYRGVILDPDAWYKDKEADDWFTPTEDEIARLEAGLASSLSAADQKGRGARVIRELADYRRQYVGMVVDGQRVVAITAFCKAEDDFFTEKWETSMIVVADGGDCFWNAKTDLTTGEVVRFSVNGSA